MSDGKSIIIHQFWFLILRIPISSVFFFQKCYDFCTSFQKVACFFNILICMQAAQYCSRIISNCWCKTYLKSEKICNYKKKQWLVRQSKCSAHKILILVLKKRRTKTSFVHSEVKKKEIHASADNSNESRKLTNLESSVVYKKTVAHIKLCKHIYLMYIQLTNIPLHF